MVSHLFFADDMLVLCKADKLSAMGINEASQDLHLYTGLTINKQKSKLFFSKGCKKRDDIADLRGVSIGFLHIKYMGLPLSFVYPKAFLLSHWQGQKQNWWLAIAFFSLSQEEQSL